MPSRQLQSLWLAPHRPFFLLAGVWGLLAPLVWLMPPGVGPEPIAWHRHELLFGMGGAAVGGYLLTALPAWTQAGPVGPSTTRALVALWCAARLIYGLGPPTFAASLPSAAYFAALAIFLSRSVLRAACWSRLPLAAAPLVLAAFELITALPGHADVDAALRLLPLFFALLISTIGGRAIDGFTRHWMSRTGHDTSIAEPAWISRAGAACLIAAIVLQGSDAASVAGPLLIAAGALQLLRMLGWRSWRTWRYPALLLLHLAWLWLPTGLVIVGASCLPGSGLVTSTALHAITMGAMGTMMLAIMSRAAMVRAEATLRAAPPLVLAFLLISVSTVVRLTLPLAEATDHSDTVLHLSALCWMSGWAFFLWDFRRALAGPVVRPVLSARKPAGMGVSRRA